MYNKTSPNHKRLNRLAYEERKHANICVQCLKPNPDNNGTLRCDPCREKIREYCHANKERFAELRRARIKQGICRSCGKPHTEKYNNCRNCRIKESNRQREKGYSNRQPR